jgi:hypothetical protein
MEMTIERGKEKAWGKREERGTRRTEVNKKGGQRGEHCERKTGKVKVKERRKEKEEALNSEERERNIVGGWTEKEETEESRNDRNTIHNEGSSEKAVSETVGIQDSRRIRKYGQTVLHEKEKYGKDIHRGE